MATGATGPQGPFGAGLEWKQAPHGPLGRDWNGGTGTKAWDQSQGPGPGTRAWDQGLGPGAGTRAWDQSLGPGPGTRARDQPGPGTRGWDQCLGPGPGTRHWSQPLVPGSHRHHTRPPQRSSQHLSGTQRQRGRMIVLIFILPVDTCHVDTRATDEGYGKVREYFTITEKAP